MNRRRRVLGRMLAGACCLLGLSSLALADDPLAHVAADAPARATVAERGADAALEGPADGTGEASSGAADPADESRGTPDEPGYEPGVALALVASDADPAALSARLAEVEGVIARDLTAEEVASGVIELSVADGSTVAEALEELSSSGAVESAQPNYVYRLAELGGPSELRETVDPLADVGEAEPTEGAMPEADASPAAAEGADEDVGAQPAEGAGEDGDAPGGGRSLDPLADAPGADGASALRASALSVNDPLASEQWALASVRAYEAWAVARCERAVTVAVIDDGCDVDHADLAANVVAPYNEYHARTGRGSTSVANPTSSHGTHVAGIVSAVADNGWGVAGVSYNARVMPIRVFDSAGNATTADLVRAYDYVMANASEHNVRVINMSLGGRDDGDADDALFAKIDAAFSRGIVTVCAAGNAFSSTSVPYDCYPGDYGTAVSVINLRQAATAAGVSREQSSNYNASGETDKNVSAPGTGIMSTHSHQSHPGQAFSTMSGTSMASPCVAGVVALEFAANPDLTAAQAVGILYGTATDLGSPGWDCEFGHGEADALAAVTRARDARISTPGVFYRTHVQNVGWQGWASDGATAGTVGRGLRMEAIDIKLVGAPHAGSIQYRAHVQNLGWEGGWRADGASAGTVGSSRRLEAIQIRLTGELAERYDVYYRVHAQNFGWLGWASNGESAGTVGCSCRLEGIQVVLVDGGAAAPGSTAGALKGRLVSYRSHVQNVGWQGLVSDGATSGTSGRSLRLEAVTATVGSLGYSGRIQYQTHIQNVGWEGGWRESGALSGTSGRALRLEAIRVRLTGELAERYDVYYRVHAQNYGWLGWARNGESAGTAGRALRLEALQMRLVPKGGPAPGATVRAFVQ